MRTPTVRSIKRISVERLFGLYDYSLAIPDSKGDGNKIMVNYKIGDVVTHVAKIS